MDSTFSIVGGSLGVTTLALAILKIVWGKLKHSDCTSHCGGLTVEVHNHEPPPPPNSPALHPAPSPTTQPSRSSTPSVGITVTPVQSVPRRLSV